MAAPGTENRSLRGGMTLLESISRANNRSGRFSRSNVRRRPGLDPKVVAAHRGGAIGGDVEDVLKDKLRTPSLQRARKSLEAAAAPIMNEIALMDEDKKRWQRQVSIKLDQVRELDNEILEEEDMTLEVLKRFVQENSGFASYLEARGMIRKQKQPRNVDVQNIIRLLIEDVQPDQQPDVILRNRIQQLRMIGKTHWVDDPQILNRLLELYKQNTGTSV